MTICSHMICPFCKHQTKIYNSRSTQSKTQTWRRHQCKVCAKTFTTKERIDWTGAVVVHTTDGSSPYTRERLLLSIVRSSTNLSLPSGAITDLTDTIELELQTQGFFREKKQESEVITQHATTILHRYDPNMALQYVNQVYSNKPPLELIKQLVGA